MGVLANVAGDTEDAVNVAAGVAQWFPTAMAALSFLIFNLLDSPCLATISTMANELNDRRCLQLSSKMYLLTLFH